MYLFINHLFIDEEISANEAGGGNDDKIIILSSQDDEGEFYLVNILLRFILVKLLFNLT